MDAAIDIVLDVRPFRLTVQFPAVSGFSKLP